MIANPDEKRGRMLLDIIMTGGNFGYLSAEKEQDFSFVRSMKYHIKKYNLLRFDARLPKRVTYPSPNLSPHGERLNTKNRSAPSIFLHAGKPGHGLVS